MLIGIAGLQPTTKTSCGCGATLAINGQHQSVNVGCRWPQWEPYLALQYITVVYVVQYCSVSLNIQGDAKTLGHWPLGVMKLS